MSLFGKILKVAAPAAMGFVTGGPAGAAAGAVSGLAGVAAGSGSKKAVNAQLTATREQIAANNANRDYQYNLNAPTINYGNSAEGLLAGFSGAGGNPQASADALNTFRGSTGYQDLLKTGLDSVNSSAYARGAGGSGAALKALQAKGASIADQSASGWTADLMNLSNLGAQGRSLVAGIGQNTVTGNNAATQNAADARSNGALVDSANLTKLLQQFGAQAVNGTGSSFGGQAAPGSGQAASPNPLAFLPQAPNFMPYNPQIYGLG